MNTRKLKRGVIAHLTALLAFLSAVHIPHAAFSADVLKIYKNRKLQKVALNEIGLSSSGVSAALNPFEADATWDGSDIDTPELLLEQVYSSTKVTRKNVLLWYYDHKLDRDEKKGNKSVSEFAFDVEYRILSRGGLENALSHKNDNASVILAHITELPVECEKKNKNKIRCFGRVNLDFDISRARRSGKYFGTVEITITTL